MSEELIALLKQALHSAERKIESAQRQAKQLQDEAQVLLDEVVGQTRIADELRAMIPPEHPLLIEWDSMMGHQRQHFGTFENYCAMQAKLHAPDDTPLVVKWVAGTHLTDEQRALS